MKIRETSASSPTIFILTSPVAWSFHISSDISNESVGDIRKLIHRNLVDVGVSGSDIFQVVYLHIRWNSDGVDLHTFVPETLGSRFEISF